MTGVLVWPCFRLAFCALEEVCRPVPCSLGKVFNWGVKCDLMRALIGLWRFQRGWLRDLCPAVGGGGFSMSASLLELALWCRLIQGVCLTVP